MGLTWVVKSMASPNASEGSARPKTMASENLIRIIETLKAESGKRKAESGKRLGELGDSGLRQTTGIKVVTHLEGVRSEIGGGLEGLFPGDALACVGGHAPEDS